MLARHGSPHLAQPAGEEAASPEIRACPAGPGNTRGDGGRSPESACASTKIPDVTGKAPTEFIGFGLS